MTTLAANGAAGARPEAPGDGKIPMSCAACQSSFLLDERASIVSARDATRTVKRPEGVVIVEDTAPEGPAYRSAHKDPDVKLGVFAPHFGRFGPILLAVGCGLATVTLMKVFRHEPWADYLPLPGVLVFYVLTYLGYSVWPMLRGPSHQLSLTREAVIALEHGREVVRCGRDQIVRVASIGDPLPPSGSRPTSTRVHLAAFDRAGRRYLLWEDVSREHAAFAEVWLEEHLSLLPPPREDAVSRGGDAASRGG